MKQEYPTDEWLAIVIEVTMKNPISFVEELLLLTLVICNSNISIAKIFKVKLMICGRAPDTLVRLG